MKLNKQRLATKLWILTCSKEKQKTLFNTVYLEISVIICPEGPQGSSLVASLTLDSTSE